MYPKDWPRCPNCGDFAMDGHITCGRAECDEGGTRRARSDVAARQALQARERVENDRAIAQARAENRNVTFIAHDGCEVTVTPAGHVFFNMNIGELIEQHQSLIDAWYSAWTEQQRSKAAELRRKRQTHEASDVLRHPA